MNLWVIVPLGLTVFYGTALFFGKRIRDWREANDFVNLMREYFDQTQPCLCRKPDADCDCDKQTDASRDNQQTTD